MKKWIVTPLLGLLVSSVALAATESWPRFRGPEASAAPDLPASLGLSLEWKKELGVGYSSIVVSGNKAVTMYAAGNDDVVAAFDVATGNELWRYRLGEKYPPHDGGDGGPVSTPTIDGDRVFALGPRGLLAAVSLADGRELWKVELDEAHSTKPFYGYTTVPLVAGDQVLVQTGGAGHALTSYDRKTGKVRWTRYDDTVQYQSPVLGSLAGRQQIVAVSDQWARGVDPKTGNELWSFRHSEGETQNGSAHPTLAGPDRVLIDLDGESLMLKVAAKGGGFAAEELWRARAFANTLALPVYRDGTLYGFTGSVLLAVDAADGTMRWRSRDVAGQNLSVTGDDLVILANDGSVVVAAASREGYQERARLAVLERGALSNPAVAGGRILVRNLTSLASVKVDAGARRAVAESTPVEAPKGDFGSFVAGLAAVAPGERQAKVDAYLAGKSLPLVEAGGIAHLVYRGKAEDVGLVGSIQADGSEIGMRPIEGTDLFYASVELDPAGHYEYAFVVDFGDPAPDAANPNKVDDFVVTSELRMPGWRANPAIVDPPADAPKGTLDRFQFKSDALANTREVQIWLPPGYARGDKAHPLVVFTYGDRELKAGKLANVLDNLTAAGSIEPPIAVFVPRLSGAEYLGDKADAHVRFLAEELIPHLEKHYRLAPEVDKRSIAGIGSAGFAAVYATFARPGTFGKAAAQTFYVPDGMHDPATKMIQESAAKPALVWIERSPFDYDQPPNNSLEDAPWLLETLRGKGIAVLESSVHGRPEWGSWRGSKDLLLVALLPPPPAG